MKTQFAVSYTSVIAIFILAAGQVMAHADELIDRLHLDYGSVTSKIDDPKAPPPSLLTAKYGFKSLKGFTPYLGTGLAYTLQPSAKPGEKTKITTGIAGQAGFSYLLDENSSLNIDYNYLHLSPDQNHGDSPPQSLGVGIKIKF